MANANWEHAHVYMDDDGTVIASSDLSSQVVDLTAGGGSRPFISDTETGIVVNRASGFVSEWEEFDLEEPGVGYGKFTVTAENGDGETFGTGPGEIGWATPVQASFDGITWSTIATPPLIIYTGDFGGGLGSAAYTIVTPRFARFRIEIIGPDSQDVYAGANDPDLTYDFVYTAG